MGAKTVEKSLFPVNGWDVSASGLKVQTLAPSNGEVSSKKSKKRKRDQNSGGSDGVTDQNVSELYAKFIDSKKAPDTLGLLRNTNPETVNGVEPNKTKKKEKKDRDDYTKRSVDEQLEESGVKDSKASGEIGSTISSKDVVETRPTKKKQRKNKERGKHQVHNLEAIKSVGNDQDVSRVLGEIENDINGALTTGTEHGIEANGSSTTKEELLNDVKNPIDSSSNRVQEELKKSIPKLEDRVATQGSPMSPEERRKKNLEKKHAKRLAKQLKKNAAQTGAPTVNGAHDLPISIPIDTSSGPSKVVGSLSTGQVNKISSTAKKQTSNTNASEQLKALLLHHQEALKKVDRELSAQQKQARTNKEDLKSKYNAEKARIIRDIHGHGEKDSPSLKSSKSGAGHNLSSAKPGQKSPSSVSEAPTRGDHKIEDPDQFEDPNVVMKTPNSTQELANDHATSIEQLNHTEGSHSEEPKKKKRKKEASSTSGSEHRSFNNDAESIKSPVIETTPIARTLVQQKMHDKLISSRFRIYNEQLYTTPSSVAAKVFRDDPNGFETYHAGFRNQVQLWPVNPVDVFITEIRKRASKRPERIQKGAKSQRSKEDSTVFPLVRHPGTGSCRIADLGCGDAKLASSLAGSIDIKKSKLSISSYDLERPKGPNALLVTKADITNLAAAGIRNPSFEVVICCLSLMSTNWVQIVEECARILVLGGEVWVAEVKSRFRRKAENKKADTKNVKGKKQIVEEDQQPDWRDGLEEPISNDDTDVTDFVEIFRRRGLVLKGEVDKSNRMFVSMKFVKTGKLPLDGAKKNAGESLYAQKDSEGKKRKFGDVNAPGGIDMQKIVEEGKVLKPCVYKLR